MSASGTKVQIPRQAWKVAVLAGMASYLDAGVIVTSGATFVIYRDDFGFGAGTLGVLSALLTLLFAVGALVGGRLGDRFGRRRVFTVTMVGLAVGVATMGAAQNVLMLYVGTVLVGFSIGADLPVSLAMIAEEAPPGAKGRLIAFSHVLWMTAIGTVLALQALVGNLGTIGARIMWLHLLVLALVVLVLRSRMPESKEWAAERERARSAPPQDAEGHQLDAGNELVRRPFVLPLVALALFYGIVNLSANTGGQFATLLYTDVAGVSVSTAGTLGLIVLGISFLSALGFMRIIESPNRMTFFLVGGVLYVVAQLLPLVFGPSLVTLVAWQALSGVGGAFAGEPMWKIWSQELFPTLLRASAQGVTTFFTRVLAALVALGTPLLIEVGPSYLFAFLTVCVAFTTALGWFWIRRMPPGQDVEKALEEGVPPREAFSLA
ncbi:MFS transporter [Cryptosporangium minutisporangium]|uniref:MFS transporter n=1 Tax=Cryptosporangium minutisporangium TaxID=113569 RepID=A0ABP6STB4_9ACTN